jgi:hypothetical protein
MSKPLRSASRQKFTKKQLKQKKKKVPAPLPGQFFRSLWCCKLLESGWTGRAELWRSLSQHAKRKNFRYATKEERCKRQTEYLPANFLCSPVPYIIF